LAADPYVYAGTNVPENLFGKRDQSKLNVIEADIVWPRFAALHSQGVDAEMPLSPDLHKTVHRRLFERVYPFAGKFRTINIAKNGEIVYANVAFLETSAETTWHDIRKRFETPCESVEDVVARLVTSMGDLHVLHPFREGNTRTLQLVIREIAWRAGYAVRWLEADPKAIRVAGTAAAVGENDPYTQLLLGITLPR
jgi:cell filamentation protein